MGTRPQLALKKQCVIVTYSISPYFRSTWECETEQYFGHSEKLFKIMRRTGLQSGICVIGGWPSAADGFISMIVDNLSLIRCELEIITHKYVIISCSHLNNSQYCVKFLWLSLWVWIKHGYELKMEPELHVNTIITGKNNNDWYIKIAPVTY